MQCNKGSHSFNGHPLSLNRCPWVIGSNALGRSGGANRQGELFRPLPDLPHVQPRCVPNVVAAGALRAAERLPEGNPNRTRLLYGCAPVLDGSHGSVER